MRKRRVAEPAIRVLLLMSVGGAAACARVESMAPGDGSAERAGLPPLDLRPSSGTDLAGRASLPAEVYAHSDRTLYRFNPVTEEFTAVGDFSCFTSELIYAVMIDIALDSAGNMVGAATTESGHGFVTDRLATIDKATARCDFITTGSFPNSLAFVPVGTVLPDREALVGYNEDTYVRIDPATGAVTTIGHLNGSGETSWISSGDIVSIIDGGTYLTVIPRGNPPPDAGGDRIAEVDPATGRLVRVIGATGTSNLFGLGYWGGVAYGFSSAGALVRIDLGSGAGTPIPLASAPASGLQFLGAGTTTAAPIVE